MKSPRLTPLFVAACVTALLLGSARAADDTTTTIKFSDPGKPGTLKINLGHGEVKVIGADTSEISVKSDVAPTPNKPRKDGLRIISAASSFGYSEKDNVVTLESGLHDWGRGGGNFRITVPRNTNIIVQNNWGGNGITCSNLSGDIEINSMHGEIKLEDVSGGVVVGTMNGEIRASLRELREGKPVSFTTMNGEVQIRVPENARANVRFRTQNGQVLTDFDDKALVTKTESAPGIGRGKFAIAGAGRGKVLSAEIEDSIREATRIGVSAAREALEAVKQGLDESSVGTDEARKKLDQARVEIDKARREADRARRDSERTTRNTARATPAPAATPGTPAVPTPAEAGAMPKPPAIPKIAAIPTITGGNLVTGTLNGGGPEISVSTMNGDVVLRKLEQK